MLEFALILPLLLLVIFGIFAFGHFMFVYSVTTSASREAARYGSAVGMSQNNIPRYTDCVAIRAAAMNVGAFGGLREQDVKVYYWDASVAQPPDYNGPLNHSSMPGGYVWDHYVGQCQDNSGNNVNTIRYYDPDGTGPLNPRSIGLGSRIEVRVTTNYVPIVPLVNLPSFPIHSFSVRTILKNVTVGTAAPAEDPNYDPNKEDVTVTVTVPTSIKVGEDIAVSWTVTDTSTTLAPTGNVTVKVPIFLDQSGTIGYRYCNDGNPVPITTSPGSGAGSCTIVGGVNWADFSQDIFISFDYDGDTNFNGASTDLEVIPYYDAIVTLTSPLNPSESDPGEQVNFTVTVERDPPWNASFPQLVAPQNTIRIVNASNQELAKKDDGLTPINNYTTQDTLSVVFTDAGNHVIRAEFIPTSTGSDFHGGTSANLTHTVRAEYNPQLVINAPVSAKVNESATIGFYFDPSTTPTPLSNTQVTIQDAVTGAICQGTVSLSGGTWSGSCSLTMTQPWSNPHTLNGSYSGGGDYNPAYATGSITVNKGDSQTLLTPNGSAGMNQPVAFSYTVSSPISNPAVTPAGGMVTVAVVGNPSLSCTGPAPSGSCTISFPAVGTYQVQATYDGTSDPNFNGSASNIVSQTIVPCPTFALNTATWYTRSNGSGYFYIDLNNSNPAIQANITSLTLRWPAASETPSGIGVTLNTIRFLAPWASNPWNPGNCNQNPRCLWPGSGNSGGSRAPVEPPPNTFTITCPSGDCRSNADQTLNSSETVKRFAFEFGSSPANGPYRVTVNFNHAVCQVIDSGIINH